MPILVIEGSNKVGKTTFISVLKKQLQIKGYDCYMMNERIARNAEVEVTAKRMYFKALDDICTAAKLAKEGKFVIFDRFHLSELVYGKFYRGYTNSDMARIHMMLGALEAEILLMLSDYWHIKNAEEKKKLFNIQEEFIKQALVLNDKEIMEVERIKLENTEGEYLEKVAKDVIESYGY